MAISKITLNGVTQMDITDTTAVNNDVASGKYFYGADGVKTAGTSSGGGGSSAPSGVQFIDYDGTVLETWQTSEVAGKSALPSNPTHTGLTAQGWNWTLSDIQTYMSSYPKAMLTVGQMYVTTSGDTEIDITLDTDLSPYLQLYLNNTQTVVIDWGDNSSTNTVTGPGINTTFVYTQHIYAAAGDYTIKLTVTNGAIAFYCSTNKAGILTHVAGADSSLVYSSCITAIRIGSNTTLDQYSFCDNTCLEYVTLPSGSLNYNAPAVFSNCYSLKALTIPSGVTNIGNSICQYCHALEYVSIPNSVTAIASSAFNECNILKYVAIPSGVTSIKSSLFNNCVSLENVNVPSGVTSISNSVFYNCRQLEEIDIPSSVTSIGTSIFNGCSSLKSITLSNNITAINSNAFSYCVSLESITIPSNVTSIGSSAFSSCHTLKSITLPSTVTSFGTSVFSTCYSLESVTLPSNITDIGASTFYYCTSLKSITIPSGVTNIGNQAFYNCYALESMTLPNNTIALGDSVFYGCRRLKAITTSGTVTISGAANFYNCSALQHFTLPSDVTTVGKQMFYFCRSLESITIPSNVTSIGDQGFQGCRSLLTITIPSLVTSLGKSSLRELYALEELHFKPTSPPTAADSYVFTTLPTTCKIYVPAGYLSAYTGATNYPSSSTYTYIEE